MPEAGVQTPHTLVQLQAAAPAVEFASSGQAEHVSGPVAEAQKFGAQTQAAALVAPVASVVWPAGQAVHVASPSVA